MKAKWLNRYNEETKQTEQFYPITHADAVIDLVQNDLMDTEAASEIVGDAPEIDPAIVDLVNSLTAEDVGALPIQMITCTYGNTDEEIIRGLSENWSKLPVGIGSIHFSNGADVWYGTYYKYTDTIGSILMQNASGAYSKKFIRNNNTLIDLYTENNKPTAYDLSIPVNNNILINSNFANPVNQRGITAETWVTEKYGIDRWRIANRFTKCSSINDEGLTFYTTDTTHIYNAILVQRVEASEVTIGETYTLTTYINDALHSTTFVLQATTHQKWINIYGVALEVDARAIASGYIEVRIRSRETTPLTVKWMKLEIGDHATPYVPRLYAEELELCRKYFREIELVATPVKISSSYIQFFTAFNAGTRILQPTVTPKGSFDIWVDGSITSGFSHNQITATDRGILWGFDKASHGLTSSNIILLNANIFVDAEL